MSAIFLSFVMGLPNGIGFWHIWAHLVAKAALGHMGQIHPISTCIQGKSAIFSKFRVSIKPKLDYVQMDPTIPLGSSRTPQGH